MQLIRCGMMIDRDGRACEGFFIRVDNGVIKEVGKDLLPCNGDEVIDASKLWVSPGLIDSHCHAGNVLNDLNEMSDPITPDMLADAGIDPFAKEYPYIREAGVTTICVLPGSGNLIGGIGVTIKVKPADCIEKMAVYSKRPFKMALGTNPPEVYREKRAPFGRMGNLALLERTFYSALDYEKDREQGKAHYDPQLEALLPVLHGKQRVHIHCHAVRDIETAIRLAKKWGLDITLDHVSAGEKIVDIIAESGIPCTIGPVLLAANKPEVERDVEPILPAMLEKAGVPFATLTDDSFGVTALPFTAGCFCSFGTSPEMARRSITINPAKLLQIDDRVGSLEPGKDADIAFFTGDPLLNTTSCVGTMIDGVMYARRF